MAELLSDADIAAGGIRVDEIQGNVLAGFNKDHQTLLFVRFGDEAGGPRAWLGALAARVATTAQVLAFNRLHKAVGEGVVQATWVNVAVTRAGLDAVGADAGGMDDAFRNGMAGRQATLGDDGPAAPAHWVVGHSRDDVHAVVIVAADRVGDLQRVVAAERAHAVEQGLQVVFVQEGHARPDAPGHEHFGFKDGISQPSIDGLHAGADGLPLSEFVLGYERKDPMPAWTRDGSYYVLRRLRQDVAGFRAGVAAASAELGVTPALASALIVGRFESGAPLAVTGRVAADPGADAGVTNDFTYAGDPDGAVVPRAAHVRKVNARDAATPRGGAADTRRHRLLRRGIPYGASYRPDADPSSPAGRDADRGLLFQCYGRSIADQFEIVMGRWVINPGFPGKGDGVDGVLSEGPFRVDAHTLMLKRFVVATGGDYFFAPSVSGLRHLAEAG